MTKGNLKGDAEKLLGKLPPPRGSLKMSADWSEEDAKLSPLYRLASYVFRDAGIKRDAVFVKGRLAHYRVGSELEGYLRGGGKDLVKNFRERFPDFTWKHVSASDFSESAALDILKGSSYFWLIDGCWVAAALKDIRPLVRLVALPGSSRAAFAQILSGEGELARFVKESFEFAGRKGLEE